MGGKGGGGGYDQNAINQAAYQAGQAGERWVNVSPQIPTGHDQALESWKAGQGAGGGGFHAGKPYDFFADAMGKMHSPGGDYQSSLDAQYQNNLNLMQQQEEERRRIEGQNARDALYSQYLDAAGAASDYINSEINQEISNAKLLGIDYAIDDESKITRVNDYFASIWGEGQQGQLEALMKEWGNPAGFEGFTVVRGDGSAYQGGEATEEQVTPGRGQRPTFLGAEEEEQGLGGGATVLGA